MDDKPWREYTDKELGKYKKKLCVNCNHGQYPATGSSGMMICTYILDTGKMRGCKPWECKECGRYEPRKRTRSNRKGK